MVESKIGNSCLTKNELWTLLRCPNCRGPLNRSSLGAKCTVCNIEYPFSPKGQLDLRLREKKTYSAKFNLTVEGRPLF